MSKDMKKIMGSAPKPVQRVFRTLYIEGSQSLLGTAADPAITVVGDYDLQEYLDYNDSNVTIFHRILEFFQNVFKEALKNTVEYPVIPDLKCGVLPGNYPVRWNKESIMKGYQEIEGRTIYFIDMLQKKSTIKIDYLSFINGKYLEFSSNYYFIFDDDTSFNEVPTDEISKLLIKEGQHKIYKDGNLLKGLKRVYAGLKLTDIPRSKYEFIVDFLNSSAAKKKKLVGDLELIPEVLQNKFRKDIPMQIIKENLDTLAKEGPAEYKSAVKSLIKIKSPARLIGAIKDLMDTISDDVNVEAEMFIHNNDDIFDRIFTNRL